MKNDPLTDPEWLFGQLHSIQAPQIVEDLKALWERIHHPSLFTDVCGFRDALGIALEKLAGISANNRARVNYIRAQRAAYPIGSHDNPVDASTKTPVNESGDPTKVELA